MLKLTGAILGLAVFASSALADIKRGEPIPAMGLVCKTAAQVEQFLDLQKEAAKVDEENAGQLAFDAVNKAGPVCSVGQFVAIINYKDEKTIEVPEGLVHVVAVTLLMAIDAQGVMHPFKDGAVFYTALLEPSRAANS